MKTEVKERPILMCGEMVLATQADRKTMTRRVVKLPRWSDDNLEFDNLEFDTDGTPLLICRKTGCLTALECPYGKPGDRLWVRETWAPSIEAENRQIMYRADGRWCSVASDRMKYWHGWTVGITDKVFPGGYDENKGHWVGRGYFGKFKPSIFMPRWASRINLEVTAVRVERLQEIGIDDVVAEGFEAVKNGPHANQYWREETVANFAAVWDKLNGKTQPWKSNPRVWVVNFNKL